MLEKQYEKKKRGRPRRDARFRGGHVFSSFFVCCLVRLALDNVHRDEAIPRLAITPWVALADSFGYVHA